MEWTRMDNFDGSVVNVRGEGFEMSTVSPFSPTDLWFGIWYRVVSGSWRLGYWGC